MKLNWGWGIFIVLALFILFMLILVYKCTQVNIDLVSENYYEKEIRYQQQIDREKNTMELQQDIRITKRDQAVEIIYPADFNRDELSGTIQFFKPDDAGLDFILEVLPSDKMIQAVNADRLKRGWWEVKIQWTYKQIDYYTEEKLLL